MSCVSDKQAVQRVNSFPMKDLHSRGSMIHPEPKRDAPVNKKLNSKFILQSNSDIRTLPMGDIFLLFGFLCAELESTKIFLWDLFHWNSNYRWGIDSYHRLGTYRGVVEIPSGID